VPPVSVELKKQVKQANDIVDVVAGSLTLLPAGGGKFKAVCPFHNDTRPSLQIDRQYQNFRCWACDTKGDVFDFVMKFDKVDFPEALRILAQRAGIKLETDANDPASQARGRLLDVMRWAEQQYQHCLLETPAGEAARKYLGERHLAGGTVRQFGLGFAPIAGDWLVLRAADDGVPTDLLVEVGLLAARDENRGFYDRFRDRVMFPIRDVRGQTVGFGGRIVPGSLLPSKAKYINSSETPLFKKSELIYGLDLARHAGTTAGCLALVEGYTDVMMAHQCGAANVVATMGTALTAGNVLQLRRYAPRVVLVFDGDEAGERATDKALELFWGQHDCDITVTTLPDGLDPCDLLATPGGPDRFREALAAARPVLDYKFDSILARHPLTDSANAAAVLEKVLGVLAMAPDKLGARVSVKQELMVTRLAARLGVRQESVWERLGELKAEYRKRPQPAQTPPPARTAAFNAAARNQTPAPKADPLYFLELTLMRLLVADPALVPLAAGTFRPEDIRSPTIRRVLADLFALYAAGETPDLDALRVRLLDVPDQFAKLLDQAEVGRAITERPQRLEKLKADFARLRTEGEQRALTEQLKAGPADEAVALDLLRRLQGGGQTEAN
jgi:DNA primase